MPIGAVLLFDEETETVVRGAWTALADAGVSRSMLMPGFRPHLTLSAGEDLEAGRVLDGLARLAAGEPPLHAGLPGLGLFADTGVVYLSVTPSAALLELHRRVDSICVRAGALDGWYRPDGWVPHVTLAFGLDADALEEAVRVLAGMSLKLSARAEVLALIEGDATGWTEHGAWPLGGPCTVAAPGQSP